MNIDLDLIERTLKEEAELQEAIALAIQSPVQIHFAPGTRIRPTLNPEV